MRFVQALGFSNGWAELALKKPPPLVPSSLMISWLAIGPIAMVCFAPSKRRCVDGAGKRLRHAESDQDKRADERDRQENVKGDPGQIGPEIADRGRRGARKAAHQREGHREAGRRGDEIVHGEAEHLGQMAHRRLAGIVLPVGVGDEADRGVEGEIRRRQRRSRAGSAAGRLAASGPRREPEIRRWKRPASPSYRRTSPARAPGPPRPSDKSRARPVR